MIIFETDFQLFLYKPIALDYFIGLYYFNCLRTGLLHISEPFSIFIPLSAGLRQERLIKCPQID